uniref:Uncharacterized protein n=1 Tax=Arundo donax TaxID=35708 RepID=A0A0A9A8P8_ARUDO
MHGPHPEKTRHSAMFPARLIFQTAGIMFSRTRNAFKLLVHNLY